MRYRVVLVESEEGFAVSCPALKGCHSQGTTREEALENIREAIQEWLVGNGETEKRDISRLAGSITLSEDPLEFQRRLRSEWS